jgi:hypothetical protein
MAEETTKFQVGEGTQAQIIIQMTPLEGTSDKKYNLFNLDFEVTFIGKGEYKVLKDDEEDVTLLDEESGKYEILVDTSKTGKASELMAVLKVKNIPTQGGKTRVEVTPQIPTGIEVV